MRKKKMRPKKMQTKKSAQKNADKKMCRRASLFAAEGCSPPQELNKSRPQGGNFSSTNKYQKQEQKNTRKKLQIIGKQSYSE